MHSDTGQYPKHIDCADWRVSMHAKKLQQCGNDSPILLGNLISNKRHHCLTIAYASEAAHFILRCMIEIGCYKRSYLSDSVTILLLSQTCDVALFVGPAHM